MTRSRIFVISMLGLLALTAGCAEVKPWQRGTLAKPSMDPKNAGRATKEEFVSHMFDTREGSTGGTEAAGGGCGCN